MSEPPIQQIPRDPVGNLTDFVEGVDENNHLDIEISIREGGHVVVFHNRTFKKEVSWFEFDLDTNNLEFVMDGGEMRNAGLPLKKEVSKYMQNAHHILMVEMNNDTGQPEEGHYIPLIVHRN